MRDRGIAVRVAKFAVPGVRAWVAQAADRPVAVPTPAVEDAHAVRVEPPDQRQGLHAVTKGRVARPRLVEDAPRHDARVVAIAEDDLAQRPLEPPLHLRALLHLPTGVVLHADHHAQLIEHVELPGEAAAEAEPAQVDPRGLHVQHIAAHPVRIGRPGVADRVMGQVDHPVQEDPLAVEAKVAVLEAEIAEATTHRLLIGRGTSGGLDAGGDAVQVGIVQPPEPVAGHAEPALDQGCAGGETCRHKLGPQRLAACGRGHGQLHDPLRRLGRRVAHAGPHANLSALPVGDHVQVLDPHCRREEQFHRIQNPAAVVRRVRGDRVLLRPGRGLLQRDAVDRLVGRVEHAHGEPVGLARLDRAGRVQHERRLAPLVAPDRDAVDPHLRQIVHRMEPEEIAAFRIWPRAGRRTAVKSRQYQATPW